MIANYDVYYTWFEMTEGQRIEVINKFNLNTNDIKDFLDRNDIKKYILLNYIKQGKVITK